MLHHHCSVPGPGSSLQTGLPAFNPFSQSSLWYLQLKSDQLTSHVNRVKVYRAWSLCQACTSHPLLLARPLHIDSSGPLCPQFNLLLLCFCVTTGVALSNPFSPHTSLTTTHSQDKLLQPLPPAPGGSLSFLPLQLQLPWPCACFPSPTDSPTILEDSAQVSPPPEPLPDYPQYTALSLLSNRWFPGQSLPGDCSYLGHTFTPAQWELNNWSGTPM